MLPKLADEVVMVESAVDAELVVEEPSPFMMDERPTMIPPAEVDSAVAVVAPSLDGLAEG